MRVESAGSRSQIEDVYRREAPRLWRALVVFSAGRTDIADDAVSEAFTRAVAHSESIEQPVAWLYRVAFRIAAKELQRAPAAAGDRVAEAVADAERPSSADHEELYAALGALSPNQRAAVFLRFCYDLPASAVASRLGVSEATARVHAWRGRQRLRKLLGGDDD